MIPTPNWTQESTFTLTPIDYKGARVTGSYTLQANGSWRFNIAVAGRSPQLVTSLSGTLNSETEARAVATAAVLAMGAIIDALPELPTA